MAGIDSNQFYLLGALTAIVSFSFFLVGFMACRKRLKKTLEHWLRGKEEYCPNANDDIEAGKEQNTGLSLSNANPKSYFTLSSESCGILTQKRSVEVKLENFKKFLMGQEEKKPQKTEMPKRTVSVSF